MCGAVMAGAGAFAAGAWAGAASAFGAWAVAETAEHLELALRRFVEAVPREALDDLPPLRDVGRRG